MFYCNECAKKYGYPETMSKSIGKCECCGEKAECNDMPSRLLPMPKKQIDMNTNDELKNKQQCAIHDVSGSVFTIEDMRKAYNAGVSRSVDDINKPTVDWNLNWHRNMFDSWFKEHYR